jgi:aryl-alcohol dehydrogenase-like predicted oxidoreductase
VKLALGTAQFGLDYGVANRSGQMTLELASKVIDVARSNGVDLLDTAIAYGSSEQALGRVGVKDFRIVTKLPAKDHNATNLERWAIDQMARSLERLQVDSIYALLLHSPADITSPDGQALAAGLAAIKQKGWCVKVGVSIYRPDQLDDIWPHFRPDIVQSPYSVLDRRLETSGWADRLRLENVEIHVRSIFLQGLLLMAPEELPIKFSKWKPQLEAVATWARQNGISQVEAAMGCALAFPAAERIVVGVDGVEQLRQLVKASKRGSLPIPMQLACEDQKLIDPTLWSMM